MSTLRGIPATIPLALLLVGGFAACGESAAKRSVDARAEALSFYAKDAPVVALLRPQPLADIAALNREATELPAWRRFRELVLRPLHEAGLQRSRLRNLVRSGEQEVEGVDAAALTAGAATPGDLSGGFPLLVLATDQAELLSSYVRKAAAAGSLQPRGKLDDAQLYEGGTASFAIRDGVLVSAPSLGLVRSAIARRDGDSDERLDDNVVESSFGDLGASGPLLLYADLDSVREADPGLQRLAAQAPWTGKLGKAVASVRAEDGSVRVEAFSKSTGALSPDELPLGAEPSPVEITAESAAGSIGAGPVLDLLADLAPVSGQATASADEVRLQATVGG